LPAEGSAAAEKPKVEHKAKKTLQVQKPKYFALKMVNELEKIPPCCKNCPRHNQTNPSFPNRSPPDPNYPPGSLIELALEIMISVGKIAHTKPRAQ